MRDMDALTKSVQGLYGMSDRWTLNSVIQDQIKMAEKMRNMIPGLPKLANFEIEEIRLPAEFYQFAGCCQLHELSFVAIEDKIQDFINYYGSTIESVPEKYRTVLLGVRRLLRICREIVQQYWDGPMNNFTDKRSSVLIVTEVSTLQTNINGMIWSVEETVDRLFGDLN